MRPGLSVEASEVSRPCSQRCCVCLASCLSSQDFVDGTALPLDENGHGTASAGIIAAEPNNGIGLTGLCWGCEIMVLKALNKEIKGTVSSFTRSLDYAIGKGVKLSNNSYGGRGAGFKGLEEAVERARQAGMIMVAAAGNYNGNNDNDK